MFFVTELKAVAEHQERKTMEKKSHEIPQGVCTYMTKIIIIVQKQDQQ